MTHQDLARDVVSQLVHLGEWTEAYAASLVLGAIEEAVAAEREACVEIAASVPTRSADNYLIAGRISDRIRARGETTDAPPSPSSPASGPG